MKKTAALGLTVAALFLSQNAQAQKVNALEQYATDAIMSCVSKNAPANWDSLVAWVDRSNPKVLSVSALSHVAGATQNAPLEVCDAKTQASLMSVFVPMIPATQANWKALFIRIDNKGQYNVFTDIALAAAKK